MADDLPHAPLVGGRPEVEFRAGGPGGGHRQQLSAAAESFQNVCQIAHEGCINNSPHSSCSSRTARKIVCTFALPGGGCTPGSTASALRPKSFWTLQISEIPNEAPPRNHYNEGQVDSCTDEHS